MLAYIFWHWPRSGVSAQTYEAYLCGFHRALANRALAGFQRSSCRRVTGAPWLPDGAGYEDWYLLDSAAALDSIGPGATSGTAAPPHDEVAALSAGGTAGLYRPASGGDGVDSGDTAVWFSKPEGMQYADLSSRLHERIDRLWMRVLVLGPTPEFCLLDPDPDAIPEDWKSILVQRNLIWPG